MGTSGGASTQSFLRLALFLVGLLGEQPPVWASLLPDADFEPEGRRLGVGLGYGGGISVDAALAPDVSLGLAAARLPSPNGSRVDLRTMYRFVSGDGHGLTIAGILGLWADTGFSSSPFPYLPPLEGGFGLAYPFLPQLVGRLNLVVPLFSPLRPFDAFGGPAAGLELGYRLRRNLEATLGLNGQGNLLGLNLEF